METPIGYIPTGESIDLTGLDMTPEQVEEAVKVDPAGVEGQSSRASRSGTPASAIPCPTSLLPNFSNCRPASPDRVTLAAMTAPDETPRRHAGVSSL